MIRVFASIESAFNNIWEVKVERSITRQYTDYIAVVMIVPILWILANAVGNYAGELLGEHDGWGFALLSRLFSMVVIWVMFTFLYMIIPNARVRQAGRFLSSSPRLMTWGTAWNGWCLTANILESRNPEGGCSLSAILIPDAPEKYFLSSAQVEKLLYKSSEARKAPVSTTQTE